MHIEEKLHVATAPTNDLRPQWTWSSVDGMGAFRFKLYDHVLTIETIESIAFLHVPTVNLATGSHTLYLQERDAAGNWSVSGTKSIVIDVTPPGQPVVNDIALTNNFTPTWTWVSGGGGNGAYRIKLNDATMTIGAVSTILTLYTSPAPFFLFRYWSDIPSCNHDIVCPACHGMFKICGHTMQIQIHRGRQKRSNVTIPNIHHPRLQHAVYPEPRFPIGLARHIEKHSHFVAMPPTKINVKKWIRIRRKTIGLVTGSWGTDL